MLLGSYCIANDLLNLPLQIALRRNEYKLILQVEVGEVRKINQSRGLSRACLLGLFDRLEKPLNRMVLGMCHTGSQYFKMH